MDSMISRFMSQLREAVQIADSANLNKPVYEIKNVFIAGLGGSGIGGDFLISFVRNECKVPIVVNKSYDIPAFVGKGTLAVCSSYSGNTEETLHAMKLIEDSGAKIVCITSGGKMLEWAQSKSYDFVKLPENWASPRACLGYSLAQQVGVLTKMGLINEDCLEQIRYMPDFLESEEHGIKEKAKEIAAKLIEKIPVIYIEDSLEPVALRFRQQINENSKMLCWHNVIPEMNHNELVGWKERNDQLAVMFFRSKQDYERNQIRMDINKEIISNLTDTVIEIPAKGISLLERSFYFIHLGDWISFYLSQMNGVDSIEVDVIDYLKKELAKYN